MIERMFQGSAVLLAVIAVYFYWAGSRDRMFVSAVVAAVAFFLSIRFQVKERNRIRETEEGLREGAIDADNAET